MSMDDPASNLSVRDAEMSDATTDDQELALGEAFIIYCSFLFSTIEAICSRHRKAKNLLYVVVLFSD